MKRAEELRGSNRDCWDEACLSTSVEPAGACPTAQGPRAVQDTTSRVVPRVSAGPVGRLY